ncbi:hypothetical protein Bbelb_071630 [Branchiostoma belcheri]|nr:hypothetical protein Bbelb_071630 [Branchiostoma belcheri]
MSNRFADVDTHAVLLMEDKEMKTYRQKMLAEKQQHDWEMKLLEKERRIAWNSDRAEETRLLSRLENINKRIVQINKENSRKQREQTRAMLSAKNRLLQVRYTKSSQNSEENEKNAVLARKPFLSSSWPGGMGYLDMFQDSHSGALKQGGLKLDPDAKPFKSQATSIPGHPSIQQTLYHIPVMSEKPGHVQPRNTAAPPQKSKNKKKRDHKLHSETNDEDTKEPVKPRLVRRASMDPKVLAALLNVDESLVQKQNQVFQRARLNSDAALRVNADDAQEQTDENEKSNKKTPCKIQRRASVTSMHLSSDLLKVGFPDWKAREEMLPITCPNTQQSPPTGFSFVSQARRSSLPSLSTAHHGMHAKLGSTATRKVSKSKTSSLDKLENVIEESEENLHHSKPRRF